MNRLDLRQLAEERLLAAKSLLLSQNWSSAFYIAGYAVELGLKSCVVTRLATEPELIFIPPKGKFAESCWTHRIDDLVKLAGLFNQRKVDSDANRTLETNWKTVSDWTELSRYEKRTQAEAESLYNAIADHPDGVMPWIRARW